LIQVNGVLSFQN